MYDDFQNGRNLKKEDLVFPVVITDRNGEEIYRYFDQRNREWADLETIPNLLQEATMALIPEALYEP